MDQSVCKVYISPNKFWKANRNNKYVLSYRIPAWDFDYSIKYRTRHFALTTFMDIKWKNRTHTRPTFLLFTLLVNFSIYLGVSRWRPSVKQELVLIFPWLTRQSSFPHYQTLQEAGMHSGKTPVCWWNEDQDTLLFDGGDTATGHHQNLLQY